MPEALYDRIGGNYARRRRGDARIAAQIDQALGTATTVLNIGSGTGSYEREGRIFIAVDPSPTMLRQRRPGAGPTVVGVAESLPFPDDTFDAAMAILTVHHWTDAATGLAEVRRVTTGPVVVLTWESDRFDDFWLVREYVPESGELGRSFIDAAGIRPLLGPCRVVPVMVPADCTDGFFAAYWRRPEAYLEEDVRAAISNLALLDPRIVERMVAVLSTDLASGEWERQHGDLRALDAYDAGYRLLIGDGKRWDVDRAAQG